MREHRSGMTMEWKKLDAPSGVIVRVPERKISDSLLDFASPLLAQFSGTPAPGLLTQLMQIVVTVWNAHVMAMELWGHPEHLAELKRLAYDDPASPPGLKDIYDALTERRLTEFPDDPRAVSNWQIEPDGEGDFRLRCEARLPKLTPEN